MDGRIGNRHTNPLAGPRSGPAPTAPLGGPAPRFAADALAVGRGGAAAPVDAALAAEARRQAEALWAAPADAQAGQAWAGEGARARVVQDLADVNDPRFAPAFGAAEAGRQDWAGQNIQAHWAKAGFGGPQGRDRAVAFLDAIAAGFPARIDALAKADPAAHARWMRLAGPILALQDAQTNATAVVLLDRALAQGDWAALEDLGRRAAHYGQAERHKAAAGEAPALAAKATALLAAQAPLERQALAALPAADRTAHAQARKALEGDPHAQLALQLLATEGKLGAPAGASLASALGQVAAQPLAEGVDRRALLAALVREVATPAAINQQDGTWTCTATVAQILVAISRPADYVRIVGGLASPAGRATLLDGQPIQRAAGTASADLTGRTPSARLWQAALMEHANGGHRYDPKLDLNVPRRDASAPGAGRAYKGLVGAQAQERLFAGATGHAGEVVGGDRAGGDSAAAMARIAKELAAGRPVPVNYYVREGVGHQILVTAIAAGEVTYADPTGLVKRVPAAEFARDLFLARVGAPGA